MIDIWEQSFTFQGVSFHTQSNDALAQSLTDPVKEGGG